MDEPGPDVAALPEAARAFLDGEVDLLPGAIGADWAAVLSGAGAAAQGALDVVDTIELGGIRAPDLLPVFEHGLVAIVVPRRAGRGPRRHT